MITVIYTTVRAEITHDLPFDNKAQALEYAQELLDYAGIPLGESVDGRCNLTAVEVVEDDVTQYNVEEADAI
jgi:hypothetical protein